MRFSDQMFDYHSAEASFTDKLLNSGFGNWGDIGGDFYDISVEFYRVGVDARLGKESQRIIHEAGFVIAYLNHEDGAETHYRFDPTKPFKKAHGWRKKQRESDSD